jgi:4-amino-4-deoxy-L-arabinose transferase-like glycosyltransferase
MTASRRRRLHIAGLCVLFLAAFLIRARHPVARPAQWMRRAIQFTEAVEAHNWGETYQQYHPGVTTMAIGGLGIRAYYKAEYEAGRGSLLYMPVYALYRWAIPRTVTEFGTNIAAGTVALAAVLAALIVAIALTLAALGGWRLGYAAGGLLTFSPFFLAEGRAFHVDALLSALMLLSALLLILSRQTQRWRYLVLSGVVGGLALLTKTPALFLLPYTGLTLTVYGLAGIRKGWEEHAAGRRVWLLQTAWRELVVPGLLWLLMAALPFLLWPAMWVRPLYVMNEMYGSIISHASNVHKNPRFFAGELYSSGRSPNRLFYPVVLAFDSSFVTFSLAIVGIVLYSLRKNEEGDGLWPMVFWLLVAYLVFFIVQMTLGDKQDQRYILPAFPALDVLAAGGLVAVIRWVRPRIGRWAGPGLIGAAIFMQALAVLPYAPHYGAVHNHLWGGNRGAVHVLELGDQHDGILYAARYLEQHADRESDLVGTTIRLRDSLVQYYPGHNVRTADDTPDAAYYLFSLIQRQRDLDPDQWAETWARFEGQPPALAVRFDGVEYLTLFAAASEVASPEVVRRGGLWLTGVAWLWTAGLVGLIVWARPSPGQPPGDRAEGAAR